MKEITERLSRFGEVSIFNFGEGWVCSCKMFVTGVGVKVEIKSDRRMHTIEDAVRQCLERCVSCISELNTRTAICHLHGETR